MRAVRRALHANADLRFALRPGLPQDHHGAQRLGKQPGDEVDVLRPIFLPQLPDLKFRDAHKTDFDSRVPRLGCQQPPTRPVHTRQTGTTRFPSPLLSILTSALCRNSKIALLSWE